MLDLVTRLLIAPEQVILRVEGSDTLLELHFVFRLFFCNRLSVGLFSQRWFCSLFSVILFFLFSNILLSFFIFILRAGLNTAFHMHTPILLIDPWFHLPLSVFNISSRGQ